jgi:phage terminase small subunit
MGNENSGRRPQATALKILRGNPSKKKLNENEVRPPSGEIEKPAWLSEGASRVWDRTAPICLHMGTLTVADVNVFGAMCEGQATLERAAAMKADPETLAAATKLEKDFLPLVRPYYALFGLEPVSRARISVPKQQEQVSKWAGALK